MPVEHPLEAIVEVYFIPDSYGDGAKALPPFRDPRLRIRFIDPPRTIFFSGDCLGSSLSERNIDFFVLAFCDRQVSISYFPDQGITSYT